MDPDFNKGFRAALQSGQKEQVHKYLKEFKRSKAMSKGTKKLLDEWKDEDSMSALHVAVDGGHTELVLFLISKGADLNAVDKTNCTPLLTAASSGNLKICKILLEQKKTDVNIHNIDKTSPLHYLVRANNDKNTSDINLRTELIDIMIKRKADLSIKNKNGETVVHQAARLASTGDIITQLIKGGANVNEVDGTGKSPLHNAVEGGQEDVVHSLLQGNADRNLKTNSGESPMDLAHRLYGENQSDEEKILKMLKTFQPNMNSSEKKYLSEMQTKYTRLATILNETQFFANALSVLVDKADYDRLAKALIHISVPVGTTVPLIRGLIALEFEKAGTEPASILRGNCTASKIMGMFSRRIGQDYLLKCVANTIRNIVNSDKIDFELDKNKVGKPIATENGNNSNNSTGNSSPVTNGTHLSDEELDKIVEKNRLSLIETATFLIKKITSPDVTQSLPREIRAIAAFISQEAKKHLSEREAAILVGGFIMLRLINPSIVAPESYGMLAWGSIPSAKARRNLIMLTKLIQNLSNGVEFGVKEPHMRLVNNFIVDNRETLVRWFDEIVKDPLKKEGGEDFADCKNLLMENGNPRRASSTQQLDMNELAFLHRLLYDNKGKLREMLVASKAKYPPSQFGNSQALLTDLEKWDPEKGKKGK
eukprot:TRINITY_DN2891_c0_g2_i1.p1 TRINITY_DN2891_c0_g2~~TRINITY_DN2891_c0_g2_i1.p1  ORF type:complete len:653 (-),score=130.75 TRINITY_DN2891_c0_g2_i1:175-2133(-)